MSDRKFAKVVFIGVATHDVIAVAMDPVLADGRILATNLVEAGGGNAATAAVALARLGVPAAFIGRIGDDSISRSIHTGLEREALTLSGLRHVPGHQSPASVIIVNPVTAQRSIVTFPGAAITITLNDVELAACAVADWIHVDQTGFRVVQQIRAAGIATPISLDAGTPVPGFDLRHIDLYAPTRAELCRLMDTADLPTALNRTLAAGPRIVAVTNGAEGSVAAIRENNNTTLHTAPAFPPPSIASTLGAGDVFHGALLAAIVHGQPLHEALRYANGAAALSCRGLDGRSAIPSAPELETFLALHTTKR